jgi:hypothetical protein
MKTCPKCDNDYENKEVVARYIFDYAVMCEDCYHKALMKSAKKG